MPIFKLTIEYDGGPYKGWQKQEGLPTVQGTLEEATGKLNGKATPVQGAGRTDAGVHALGQIAHIKLQKNLRPDSVSGALNFYLDEHPISILRAEAAPDDFHARFSAREREYLYRILPRRERLALRQGRVWRVPYKLDVSKMHDAAQILVGTHDFSTFRDGDCQAKSPVKTLDEIRVVSDNDEVHIHVRAKSFLHKQVRSITGTLLDVGRGHWGIEDVDTALQAKNRTACGPVAPPDGLYLVKVSY